MTTLNRLGRKVRGPDPSTTGQILRLLELFLWGFGLGWLRVAYDPAAASLITRVLDPAGAGGLARFVLVALAIIGAAGIFTCSLTLRRAHLGLAAGWWVTVEVLTYLQVTPVHGFWRWLPNDTGAYSYLLIACVTVTTAVYVARRDTGCAP